MSGRRKRLMAGTAKPKALSVIASGFHPSASGTMFADGFLAGVGALPGDILFISLLYGDNIAVYSGGSFVKFLPRVNHSWMYPAHNISYKLGEGDFSYRFDLSGVQYGPVPWIIIRAASSAAQIASAYVGSSNNSVLTFNIPAEGANKRVGLIVAAYDRDGSSVANVTAPGYEIEQSTAGFNGVFGAAIWTNINGPPRDAHTVTFSNFPASAYTQGGVVWELRA